jgi:polyisoprenyl-teichoic acid--peptidoglycan teichoic acid transferase
MSLVLLPPQHERRTWWQRAVLLFNSLVIVASLATAVAVYFVADTANSVKRVDVGSNEEFAAAEAETVVLPGILPAQPATFDLLEAFDGENWLVTASDSRDCIDPNSPLAGAFLNSRQSLDDLNHTDTMMVFRLDTSKRQAAILSIPRDLWVEVSSSGRKNRINITYDPKNPKRMTDTIRRNLGINIDHYMSIDFCGFKEVVDELGGIAMYFDYPVLDKNTGINKGVGCQTLTGEEAVAYARSREIAQKINGKWVPDTSVDLGRIARQQAFVKRLMEKAIAIGPRDPTTAAAMIRSFTPYLSFDTGLTNKRLADLALQLRGIDPATIQTFQLDVDPKKIDGNAVLLRSDTKRNRRLLEVFQGKATLAAAAEVNAVDPTAPPSAQGATSSTSSAATSTISPSLAAAAAPQVAIQQADVGFVPRNVPECPP